MPIRLKIADLHAAEEAGLLRFGFADAITNQGTTDGDSVDIDPSTYSEIHGQFQPLRGLGDAVKASVAPVAKAFGLQNCGGCKERQEALNKLIPL